MDVVLGLTGRDFAIVAADMTAARSIMCFKHDEDKISQIDDRKVLATAGEQSSRTAFAEFIQKNLALKKLQTGLEMSNHATANYVRYQIAEALRTRGAHQTNSILAGYDEEQGPGMYYIDYFGSLQPVKFTAHGYGSYFSLSLMDNKWHENLSLEEGIRLVEECCDQLKLRFLINQPKFKFKIVTEQGIKEDVYEPKLRDLTKK